MNSEKLIGLELCEFDDECDFCDDPKEGSYCRLIHNPEDVTETEFYICGKCVKNSINAADPAESAAKGRFFIALPPGDPM